MTITVEAIYENGVLKPKQPLQLPEGAEVQVTVRPSIDVAAALSAVERSYGLLRWTGDAETLQRIALDDEFSIWEAKRDDL